MLTFSEQVKEKSAETQRRLYTLFQREVKAGRIPALKLLTRFELQGSKGQARQVQDYAFTDETGQQVSQWLAEQEQPKQTSGYTVEQLQRLTDQDLATLIRQQKQPKRKRKAAAKKSPKATASNAVDSLKIAE